MAFIQFDKALIKLTEDLAKSRSLLVDIKSSGDGAYTEGEKKHLVDAVKLNIKLIEKDLEELTDKWSVKTGKWFNK